MFDSQEFEIEFQSMQASLAHLGIDPNSPDFDLAVACLVRESLCSQFAEALYEAGLSEQADTAQINRIQRTPREQRAIANLNRAIAAAQ